MKPRSVLGITLAFGLAAGCSSGPSKPKVGSAAFLWNEAKQSYRIGDLQKTDSTLAELTRTDNVFAADAGVWQLVISAGLTQGFSELADTYDQGAQRDLANALEFRNEAHSLRSFAATAALEFAQAVHNMAANQQDPTITLAFAFPTGSAVPPEELLQISNGVWPRDSDRESVEFAMLQRGVIQAVSAAVGRPEDPAAAAASFQAAEVRVPRETFIYGMARLLYQESGLFGAKRMDRPDRFLLMCREARESLQSIPESDATKALAAQIEETLKTSTGI